MWRELHTAHWPALQAAADVRQSIQIDVRILGNGNMRHIQFEAWQAL
jgi:hypothetical protein